MLHWITIVAFLGLAATAAVANNLEGQAGISDISQQILESKNAELDSSILHRVPRSRHHHRQQYYSIEEPIHYGRAASRGRSASRARQAMAGRGMNGQAGRGNIFNWDIDASSGKNGKKGINKVQTDDASLENH